jgi:hypothetical protein
MGMFTDARASANDRLAGQGMGEFGEDPMAAGPDPAAELMMLIDQVPDPALADAMRQAAAKLTGGAPEPDMDDGALQNDPVVGP